MWFCNYDFDRLMARLARIEQNQQAIMRVMLRTEKEVMASIDEVLADVAENDTLIAGVTTLIGNLRQEVADAIAANGKVPPDVAAKIDQVFAGLEAQKAKIAASLAVNVPGIAPTVAPMPPATP